MKYEFEKYKDTHMVKVERGNVSIDIINGEAICYTEDQKDLAKAAGGKPMIIDEGD